MAMAAAALSRMFKSTTLTSVRSSIPFCEKTTTTTTTTERSLSFVNEPLVLVNKSSIFVSVIVNDTLELVQSNDVLTYLGIDYGMKNKL